MTVLFLPFKFRFYLFIYFVWLFWLGLLILLNKSCKRGHPCFLTHFRGNAFGFSPVEYDISSKLVIHGFYYVEVCPIYMHFVETFFLIISGCCILVKKKFCIYWDDHITLFCSLLMWFSDIIGLQILNHSVFCKINLTWFNSLSNLVLIFCWGFWCLCSSVK